MGHISGPGLFSVDVVGESHYQRALQRISGRRTEDSVEIYVQAVLVHEDQNPHDRMAIRVDIKGQTVGYLDRETARSYRKALAAAGQARLDTTCDAVIVGGWDRGPQDRGHFGVRLDLPTTDDAPSIRGGHKTLANRGLIERVIRRAVGCAVIGVLALIALGMLGALLGKR